MLYLLYAESANFCGYGMHFVVESNSDSEAIEQAEPHVEEYFYDQEGGECNEEYGEDFSGPYGNILTVEEFDSSHKSWEFFIDPTQSEFYYKVN